MKDKNVLINEIIEEINGIPIIYLHTIYALIRSFKETIPIPEKLTKNSQEDDFDWDSLLSEIHENRKKTNLNMKQRIDFLVGD